MSFKTLGIGKNILKAIAELGFAVPTEIQSKIIPQLLVGERDLIGLAQTGTGKTAAFGLPLLEMIAEESRSVQALILCPTRELCLQITRDLESFARYREAIRIQSVYGGADMPRQLAALRKGVHIIIATPGRLLDLINRGAVDISQIRHLVLDEADIMLSMGFKEELDAILAAAAKERRTYLFSATMTGEVEKIASHYMRDPLEVIIGQKNSGIGTVEHSYYTVHAKDKYAALKRIVDYYPDIYALVFCRTRHSTQEIADKMIKDGYNADALHGDLSQQQRELVMNKFRHRNLQLLFATDIAARGLDVNDLTHVIHYDLPDEIEAYTHRSGRTGRAGKTGLSLAIINLKERQKIKRIEQVIKRPLMEAQIPLSKEICVQQLLHFIDKVKSVAVDAEQLGPYMSIIEEKLAALDREALLQHFVSLEFNRFLDYYKNLPELVAASSEKKEKSKRKRKSNDQDRGERLRSKFAYSSAYREDGFSGVVINLGKKDKISPPQLIGLINEKTRTRNIRVGRIDIGLTSSRIDVETAFLEEVYSALAQAAYRGRKLRVSLAGSQHPAGKKGDKKTACKKKNKKRGQRVH
jgi:ATP-dependent RNA helicase DeaD